MLTYLTYPSRLAPLRADFRFRPPARNRPASHDSSLSKRVLIIHTPSIPQELLSDFIRTFRSKTTRFYYHTDEDNLEKLVAVLKVCPTSPAHRSAQGVCLRCVCSTPFAPSFIMRCFNSP